MGRRRDYDRRDLPPNLYVRNNGYYSYRHPETGKEFGLGRDRRIAITEAIQANLDFYQGEQRKPLSIRIAGIDTITFHSWLDRYEIVIANRGLKPKTLSDYASKLRAIRAGIENQPITELSIKTIAAFLNGYVDAGKSAMSKLMRSTLNDIFREAMAEGYITSNPVTATRATKNAVKRSRITLEEFRAIRELADTSAPWLGSAMDLAIVTGQRVGDISEMRWSDVREGLLYVEQSKTKTKLAIPEKLRLNVLDISLSQVLESCKPIRDGGNILTSPRSDQLSAGTISRAFLRARISSGLTFEGEPPTFHELRSLAARLYEKQEGMDFAKHLLGHKSDGIAAQYRNDRGREWDIIEVG